MTSLFITATDTDVGKTLVTALVALHLRARGQNVGVFKPFATGGAMQNGALVSPDALWLRAVLGLSDSLEEISPLVLEEPLAPLVAARRAQTDTANWPQIADKALRKLQKKYDVVVVEGVGGVAVPVCEVDGEVWTVADFIQAWDVPALVVARRTLGTINHSLLTLRATPNFAGLIWNDASFVDEADLSAQTTPAFFEELDVPIRGIIPFLSDKNAATLEKIAATLDLENLESEVVDESV